ncbi:MBL fold metallo-hydrolase [Actinopolymorpha pittospori]|uniref:Glyoxylase-like metal-dependent hydrolase (Beta-lactamase superfamily II) n=1 Tax=Actinopolymorpha pittospori TaxID=648752 RepID=A0A927N119_9ACTN|nr:MBL fold metallo-hydrolase [Actinopolymorpha pittospori]MBE1610656.1 glyoxylase-like metal-dependent hydrolase (beta-lactamase superfamily II) [Actinopolymorpha pittospori]
MTGSSGGYEFSILIQGFPGRSTHHGGLGWSTVPLLRGHGETMLVDTGGYGYRIPLLEAFEAYGVAPEDVTTVLLTHCHWDHAANFPLFPNARVVVPRPELEWAAAQPVGTWELPEFHVAELARAANVTRIEDGDEPLPRVRAIATPGHTPGHFSYQVAGTEGPLVFGGDAVKNEVELLTAQADMTLDPAQSSLSIKKIRDLLASDPSTILVCGHDRLLSLRDDKVIARSELHAGIKVWRATSAGPTIVDLSGAGTLTS